MVYHGSYVPDDVDVTENSTKIVNKGGKMDWSVNSHIVLTGLYGLLQVDPNNFCRSSFLYLMCE